MSSSEGNSKGEDQPQPKSNILQQSKFSLKSSLLRPSSLFTPSANSESISNSTPEKTAANTFSSSEKENASGGEATRNTTPTASSNPFKNVECLAEGEDGAKTAANLEAENKSPVREENSEKKADPLTPLTLLAKNGLPKSNLFSNISVTSTITDNSGFVFGQNVHERVIMENKQPATTTSGSTPTENLFSAGGSSSSSTGSAGLFANSFSADTKPEQATENGEASSKPDNGQSLEEAARKYFEESRGAQKRKYDEVETVTGEEDERNILEINCKLFAFLASNYEERGRGTLRLNDSKKQGGASRVVFRTSGVLRVLMNTKIWANMIAEPASQKSLRLTAIDNDGHIKVFLVMARPDDINQLHSALNRRINAEKQKSLENAKHSETEDNAASSPKKAALEPEPPSASSS